MLSSFLTISFSELMENDIAKAVACAKQIVNEQGITAWYVVSVFRVFFSPIPVLLRCNWHTALWKFKVYSKMTWLTYTMKSLSQ